MEAPENVEALIKWLKSNHITEVYEAPEHFIVLLYIKCNYHFDETIPEEFWNIKIQYHYPEIIIMSNGESHLVNTSKYNSSIEFTTLKIFK